VFAQLVYCELVSLHAISAAVFVHCVPKDVFVRQQNKHTNCTSSCRLLGNTLVVCLKPNAHRTMVVRACTSSRFSCAQQGLITERERTGYIFSLPCCCCWQRQHWLAAAPRACCIIRESRFCACVLHRLALARAHKWIVCISNAHPVRFDEPHRRHACANVSEPSALISPVAKI
jgi:hypothetical protein